MRTHHQRNQFRLFKRKKERSEAGEAKVRTAELDVELESEMVLKRSYHMDT